MLISYATGFYFVSFSFSHVFFFFSPSFQMYRMHDLFIVGSGEAMLQLIPPAQCRRHCQSVAMPLEPGDIGRYPRAGWGKVSHRIFVVLNSRAILRIDTKFQLGRVKNSLLLWTESIFML